MKTKHVENEYKATIELTDLELQYLLRLVQIGNGKWNWDEGMYFSLKYRKQVEKELSSLYSLMRPDTVE